MSNTKNNSTHKNILLVVTGFSIMLIALFLLPLVSSVPPVTTVQPYTTGYIIEGNPQEIIKLNQTYTYNFFVYNISNGKVIRNDTAWCSFYLANDKGEVIFIKNVTYYKDYKYWGLTIDKGNFSYVGHYNYGIKCSDINLGGALIGYFETTTIGEKADVSQALVYISLLGVLIAFLGICILFFLDIDNLLMKVTMTATGYLLLISIFFVSWQMSLSLLGSADFLSYLFQILFYMTMWGALPILIGFFAWWFIQVIRMKEIAYLMDRGLPEGDARSKLKEYGKY